MKVSTTFYDVTLNRTISITDGPVVGKEYSETKLIVDSIDIILKWEDCDWAVQHRYDVTLHGYAIKNDGTPGLRYTSTVPTSEVWKSGWLTEIITAITPTVDGMIVPALHGKEVGE